MNTTTETLPTKEALDRLAEHYPRPALGLNFESPRQLPGDLAGQGGALSAAEVSTLWNVLTA